MTREKIVALFEEICGLCDHPEIRDFFNTIDRSQQVVLTTGKNLLGIRFGDEHQGIVLMYVHGATEVFLSNNRQHGQKPVMTVKEGDPCWLTLARMIIAHHHCPAESHH